MLSTSLLAIVLATSSLSAIHAPYVLPSPIIDVSSGKSLLDQEINITIKKLNPKELITIQANTIDDNSIKWISNASFQADDCGIVDLATQPPITGSYEGTDPIGLLWSMQPESGNPSSFKVTPFSSIQIVRGFPQTSVSIR